MKREEDLKQVEYSLPPYVINVIQTYWYQEDGWDVERSRLVLTFRHDDEEGYSETVHVDPKEVIKHESWLRRSGACQCWDCRDEDD